MGNKLQQIIMYCTPPRKILCRRPWIEEQKSTEIQHQRRPTTAYRSHLVSCEQKRVDSLKNDIGKMKQS